MDNNELERRQIVAENIKRLVKEKGITQKELAKAIGMSQNVITEYVKFRSFPPGGVLQKMADYFGVKKSDIDTTWKKDVNSDNTPIINETVATMKKLKEHRQKIVLKTAQNQLKEQESETTQKEKVTSISKKVYTEADFDRMAREAVAFGGGELSDNDIEYLKDYLRNNTDKIKNKED